MLNEAVSKALNDHVNAELYSAYLYLAMAAHFESCDLQGFAHWMNIQVREELLHVMKVYDYINERDGRVVLAAIPAPPTRWSSAVAVLEETLRHEQEVSQRINQLLDLAMHESDHATANFLQWFVAEQVEEEATAKQVLQKVRMVEESPSGMFVLDQELGTRTLTAVEGNTG